ncbi:LysM domain-containing protein [Patulibacter sp. NPDC049589]|uniref:LysM peptidoglycan-binding domain-containing protein n=1 Tax=Patulibacter sp. NPDC049589 TaxID=3154731 RepID=UPI00341FA595
MPPRSPFRIVAPLALVAVVVAVYLLVSPGTDSPAPARPAAETTTTVAQPKRRTYTVRTGDSFSSVAHRYRITVERLIELNPKLDPQTLRHGQRLRLRD